MTSRTLTFDSGPPHWPSATLLTSMAEIRVPGETGDGNWT